jgi:hypothetical protein
MHLLIKCERCKDPVLLTKSKYCTGLLDLPQLPDTQGRGDLKSILKTIYMDNYQIEKQTGVKIQLPDSDAKIELFSTNAGFQPF